MQVSGFFWCIFSLTSILWRLYEFQFTFQILTVPRLDGKFRPNLEPPRVGSTDCLESKGYELLVNYLQNKSLCARTSVLVLCSLFFS